MTAYIETPVKRGPKKHSRLTSLGRVRAYFDANPEEELTAADMCAKFDLTQVQFHNVMQALRSEGEIEYAHVIRRREKGRAS